MTFNRTELSLMALSSIYVGGLAGCVTHYKAEEIDKVSIVKIETPLARQFCSDLLESQKRGCAIRMRNTETGRMNCVIVTDVNDVEAIAHEALHCLGYDH
jgi:hypothetical protein